MSVPAATAGEADSREGPLAGKLIGWCTFVGLLIAVNYTLNYTTTESDAEKQTALYKYSTAVSAAVVYAVMLAVVVGIAGRRPDLLALRRPNASWLRVLALLVLALVLSYTAIALVDSVLHGGREQGLVPKHWKHRYAGAYAANWVAVAAIAPFVEELVFRGLGFSLIARQWGRRAAILAIGFLFAASHGFVQALPELMILGCVLAWFRARYDSAYPGMLLHATFNSIALSLVFFGSS